MVRHFQLPAFKPSSERAFNKLVFIAGMSEVEELNIVKNKIDRIEDFSIPSPNVIRSINLDGNHILEIPTMAALRDMRVEKVLSSVSI